MPEKGILETRRNFYALLYRMYLEPPPREFVSDLMNERFYLPDLISEEELSEGFKLLREFVQKNKGKAIDDLQKDLVGEYTRLFIGPHRLPVQPYESWWVDGKLMGGSLLKVKQVYRKAGIAKANEYAEPEDHIAFELRFMHYLCEEELSANTEERIAECLNMQKEYLNDHLLMWVPDFCDALTENKLSDFYKGIARLTKGFILLEEAVIEELLETAQQ
jgi:TorA maturation chaperone TorD